MTAALRADAAVGPQPTRETLSEKYARFDAFLNKLHGDVYPELPSELHANITAQAYALLKQHYKMPAGAKVLDVGCGQGVALAHFAEDKLDAVGIALGEDVQICRDKGFNALEMNLAFLEFPEASFDVVWCRHVMEHSIFPLFSLAEAYRVLKPGGILYMEVPAPDTVAHHEKNPNHYSCLTKSMWTELLLRAGYREIRRRDISVNLRMGPDVYWSFYAFK